MFNNIIEMFGVYFLRQFIILMVVLTIIKVIRAARPNAKEVETPSPLSVIIALLLIAVVIFSKVASAQVAVGGDVPFFERHEAVVTEVSKSESVQIDDDGEEYVDKSYTAFYEYEDGGVKINGSGESFDVKEGDKINVYTILDDTTLTDYTMTWVAGSIFILGGCFVSMCIPDVIGNMIAHKVQKRRRAASAAQCNQLPPM